MPAAAYSGGSGTEDDPYWISTRDDVISLRHGMGGAPDDGRGYPGTTVTFTATTPGFSLFAIGGGEQAEEAVTTPTAAQTTSRAAAQPTAEQTTAAPAGEPAPEFSLGTVALSRGAILVLIGAGYLVRRWCGSEGRTRRCSGTTIDAARR